MRFVIALAFWAGLALAGIAACGDDDENTPPSEVFGACDLRGGHHSCIESTGSVQNQRNQEDGCLEHGGTWSDEPCDASTDRVGCCSYTFGMKFRECFYEGHGSTDPVGYCNHWDDGVWAAD